MWSIRKIGLLGRTYRQVSRYEQILRVLFRYGFSDLIEILKIEQYIEIGLKMISRKRKEHIENLTRAERVRLALEELGPTFIKLGQILSTRPDLIPLEYVEELAKLQDHVSPFPWEEVREIVKSETGRFPEEIFAHFEETPLAAASIGQVHRATLKDGDEVVVKVQRPGIRKVIEVDIEILHHLASLMERHLQELEVQRPTRAVEEFARSLEKELNFTVEASHVEHFAAQFLNDQTIYVPKVYRDLTTERILTMEYVHGIKASMVEDLEGSGADLKELARRNANLIMTQIFVHGFFHADPHPGNVFVLPGNIICYLDFGMMGRINPPEQENFADFVMQIVRRNERKIADAVMKLTYFEKDPDRGTLERDLAEWVDLYYYRPLKDVGVAKLLHQLVDILTRHHLCMKPNMYLMMKAIGTAESLARAFDPEFEIIKEIEPFIRHARKMHRGPVELATDVAEDGADMVRLLRDIPYDVRAILRQVRDGKTKILFEHSGIAPLISAYDRVSKRISFAIVLASLVIGSSLIVHAGLPPHWHQIPVIGLLGFVVAGLLGFWLLISILRGGKM
jgi:ubiquinone biosynthesis protein